MPLPLLAALAAALIAILVIQVADPNERYANDEFRTGADTGLVLRFAILAALGAWLAQRLFRGLRDRREGRAASGAAPLARYGAGLVAVIALAVLPEFIGPSEDERRDRDFRAGFIDGCAEQQRRDYCTCLYDNLKDTRGLSRERIKGLLDEARRSGSAPPEIAQAANDCGGQ